MARKRLTTIRRAAVAGMIWPALFGGGLAVSSTLQYEHMLLAPLR